MHEPSSPTPTFTSSDGGSLNVPPSPTLSTQSSVQLTTSLALRDNNPEEKDGLSSLRLLPPALRAGKHQKMGSMTNSAEGHSSLEGTEPDHSEDLLPPTPIRDAVSDETSTTMASPTHTHFDDASVNASKEISKTPRRFLGKVRNGAGGVKQKRSKGDSERNGSMTNEDNGQHQPVELAQDDAIDSTPFKFKPFQLASLVDGKDLDALKALGGVEELLVGLGTNRLTGLSKMPLVPNESIGFQGDGQGDGRPGAGTKISVPRRHDRRGDDGGGGVPGIIVTAPEGDAHSERGDSPDEASGDKDPAFSATLERRRQIYGENMLPHRRSKTLLQLMWAAWKDKVLVRCAHTASFNEYLYIK